MPLSIEAKAHIYDMVRQTMILMEAAQAYVEAETPKTKRKYTRRKQAVEPLAVTRGTKPLTRRGQPRKK